MKDSIHELVTNDWFLLITALCTILGFVLGFFTCKFYQKQTIKVKGNNNKTINQSNKHGDNIARM